MADTRRPPDAHFDPRPPQRRSDRELDEIKGCYIGPEQDDPEARAAVVAWLARLLAPRVER